MRREDVHSARDRRREATATPADEGRIGPLGRPPGRPLLLIATGFLCVWSGAARAQFVDRSQCRGDATTAVDILSPENGTGVYVLDVLPGWSAENAFTPTPPPRGTPCRLLLPDGLYRLDVGAVQFSVDASGRPQTWDVRPKAGWAWGLGLAMAIVGGALLGADVLMAVIQDGLFPGGVHVPLVATLGAVSGALVLGSIPLFVYYSGTGSATERSASQVEPSADFVLAAGAAVTPAPDGLPTFCLTIGGGWRAAVPGGSQGR